MADQVTGARTEVELTVDMSPERFWGIVTDVSRIGEFSPECIGGAWLDTESPGPRAGARFSGTNDFGEGRVGDVTCVVIESEPARVFSWVVLDQHKDPERPGAIWRYDLSPAAGGGTLVRHTFVHGPGDTGLRVMTVDVSEEQAAGAVRDRLAQLHKHMTETITAMAAKG